MKKGNKEGDNLLTQQQGRYKKKSYFTFNLADYLGASK